ncbi:hypothetical protein IBA8401_05940 [Pseudomonas syringae]
MADPFADRHARQLTPCFFFADTGTSDRTVGASAPSIKHQPPASLSLPTVTQACTGAPRLLDGIAIAVIEISMQLQVVRQ